MKYRTINPEIATRMQCIVWLVWNDPNGCYVDESCDLECIPRLTVEYARLLVADMMLGGIDADDTDMTDAELADKYGSRYVAARRVVANHPHFKL